MLSFVDREGAKRNDIATVLFSGFSNKIMSHLVVVFFCSYMLCIQGCPSFSSPRSVELCVLNRIMCLSECFPSVFDEIAPNYTDMDYFFSSVTF